MIDSKHAVRHFAWAIANLYCAGNNEVKTDYVDALKRPETLPKF